jgi:cell division protein FtsN
MKKKHPPSAAIIPIQDSGEKLLPPQPVSPMQVIRQTSHRVMPSRDSGRPIERHNQRRQPKRGRMVGSSKKVSTKEQALKHEST